ncbi:MAG: sigma-E factor negative regulatory protein [Glaciimonas sp.]|nr:sigma-E factor negative regulatory protein [Glaciimonas sp.]
MEKMTQEHISAFVDSELVDQEFAAVLAALHVPEQREVWDVYHRIGDVLRSEDLAYEMRPQAQQRMAALLDAEPIVLSLVQTGNRANKLSPNFERLAAEQSGPVAVRIGKHFFRPGLAVAAAVVAFFAAPPLMVAFNGWGTDVPRFTSSGSPGMAVVEQGNIKLKAEAGTKDSVAYATDTSSSNAMLHDSNIDEYLFAHQRFSRSGYSNAQYARPASFPTEIQSN